MSATPAGYGYRILKNGETTRGTDECWIWNKGPWKQLSELGIGNTEYEFHSALYPHRRKIDVGEGYRLLNEGEIIEHSDEFLRFDGIKWSPAISAGKAVAPYLQPHRRRIASGHYIICTQENGVAYRASGRPFVHQSLESAQEESNRLALAEGKKFVIFKAVAATEPTYREEVVRKISGCQTAAV